MTQKFTLDTSGYVYLPGPEDAERHCVWEDLSPFAQGYVEALLRSMEPEPGQWFYMPSAGVHVGATFLRFGTVNGVENKAWAIVHLDQGGKRCAGPTRHELTRKLTPRLSDLHPEALAMILRDCEALLADLPHARNAAHDGMTAWDIRQHGGYREFRPLVVSLDDAGKVVVR